MSKDWDNAAVAELTRLWNDGLSTAEIGRRMGLGKNAVIGKVHRVGLAARPSPISGTPQRWTIDEDAQLRALWRDGLSHRAIGRLMGRGQRSVEFRVSALRLPKRAGLMGFVHRAPVARAPAHGGNPDRARALRIAHASPRPPRAVVLANAPVYAGAPLSGACRYPLWGDRDRPAYGEHRFCDGPRAAAHHRYCHAHAAVCFRREGVAA